jgi:Tfp pilus tip-associated adhesin PilY1
MIYETTLITLRKRIRTVLISFLVCVVSGLPNLQAQDLVNDDTDIFLANPNVDANRPNVLVYVDNTANWNLPFSNEKSALRNVLANLSEVFNVGLMMFPESGGGNDAIDGGYVRFGIRQMTEDNKTTLTSIVDDFDILLDKGDNATTALGMVEVYRYFAGDNARAGHGKIKSDYANNIDEPGGHPASNAGLGEHPLPSSPTSSSEYESPIADACQSNFLIYLSNGPTNENAEALSIAEAELASKGYDTSSTINLTPNGQEGNWMDEWTRYMANADINPDLDGVQNLTTYVVEVDPTIVGQGDDMTALMRSVALNGNGEYFAVSSGNNGQAIVNALNSIFQEIQAVNSVFASTTLPVSVNVRGTNLNQVYIGVFRPDAKKSPRWFGNLKMYQLGFDDSTQTLFLADASGTVAENPETGFINSNSASHWTESSSFWGYRPPEQNGAGGFSDLPDGDLVEKGGSGQMQRIQYATDQSVRELYTCTSSCSPGDPLSATPFSTANVDITASTLELDTKAISKLTGFDTKPVISINDSKVIEGISLVDRGYFLGSLTNTSVTQTITNLTSNVTKNVTNINNNQIDQSIANLSHPTTGPGPARRIVTAQFSSEHGLSSGTPVTITGANESGYNGTYIITVQDGLTFTYNAGSPVQNENSPATGSPIATTTSSIVSVTVPSHEFTSGTEVTLSGMQPTSYNDTYNITVTDADTFSFSTASSLSPITDFSSATISGPTSTATATLAGHGYVDGATVAISGANETEFNGVQIITVTDPNFFTYTISDAVGDATGTVEATQGSTMVTGTTVTGPASITPTAHGITAGTVINISGANVNAYNGVFIVENIPTSSTFVFDAGEPLPPTVMDDDAAVFYCETPPCDITLAVVNDHNIVEISAQGFPASISIEGANDNINTPSTTYNGNNISVIRVTDDSFRYTRQDGNYPEPAFGEEMSMRYSTPLAFAMLPNHGYTTGDLTTIKGADQSEYNGEFSVFTIDSDNFYYRHDGSGFSTVAKATGELSSSRKTTIARARTVNHGFVDGNVVTITGAIPGVFNGNYTVTAIDANNFTYDLTENGGTEQGDAIGTIVASTGSVSGAELTNLVQWVRGQDNFEDENGDGFTVDVRASIHGDVLHSRPAVVNFNRHGNDDDVFVFYGANDGIFRAVKGGFNQSAAGQPEPGEEVWGFIPEEFFPKLQRLRNNEPRISSSNKKPYFADGTVAVLAQDNSGPGGINVPDGKLDTTVDNDSNPDRVILYVSMRRGGRFIYALDVSIPENPVFLWRKSFADPGMAELGYTWSAPTVLTTNANGGNPMIMFGAGYDPLVEDINPANITALDSGPHTTVTVGAANYTRSMGRGVYTLDALTGNIIWQAGPPASDPGLSHHFETVSGMDYAIPSNITAITDRNNAPSIRNRAYVGDTGGNMWRIDMEDTNVANWEVTKLASIANHSTLPAGNRKFMFAPDVVYSDDGFDAVLIGSGDREHPFDTSVENRFYMFKDTNIGTSVDGSFTTFIESDLFNTTSNCIQDGTACSGVGDELDSDTAHTALTSADGWFITMGAGEKIVGNAVTLNNVTFFNTNQPGRATAPSDCSSDLGIARQYKVRYEDATAIIDQNIDGITNAADRSLIAPGGGYLPSPVPVMVEIDGQIHEGVISGIAVDEPPGSLLNARLRRFWYKEME